MPRPPQRPTMITGLSHAAAMGAQAMANGTPAATRQEAPPRQTIAELAADLRRQGILPPRGVAPKPPVAHPSTASRANATAVGQSPDAPTPARDSGSQRAPAARTEPRFSKRTPAAPRHGKRVKFAGESQMYELRAVNPDRKA